MKINPLTAFIIFGLSIALLAALLAGSTYLVKQKEPISQEPISQEPISLGGTGANNIFWKLSGGNILPSLASWGLRVPSLVSCDTLDTDANGVMSCGTDDVGAGSQTPWTSDIDGAGYDLNNVGEITATHFTATSTASSTLPRLDTTRLSFTTAWGTTLTSNLIGNVTGNADTATALAANGGNCAAGSYPLGVDASGAVESCTDATTEIDSAISTHASNAEAHQALVTLAGEDYLSLSTQLITANAINPDNLAAADFGNFTCNGTLCTIDNNSLTADMLNTSGQVDEYCATYEMSSGSIEWQVCESSGTLDQAYDFGGAGSGRSITADSGAVEITVPDASNNVGLVINQNDVTNDPASVDLRAPSSQTSGQLGAIDFNGFDSGANLTQYAKVSAWIDDNTNGSEEGYIFFRTMLSGTSRLMATIGDQINGMAVGDATVGAGILSSQGNQDLTLQTGNSTTGTITITDGANGDIAFSPNGTGDIVCNSVCRLYASSNPTVDDQGDIALNTALDSLSIATSTGAGTTAELPIYDISRFAYASTSWTSTSTRAGSVTTPNFNERITTGTCYADGTGIIRVGDGTNWSNQVSLASGTTTVTFTSNNYFNKNGERWVYQIGTPSSLEEVQCSFELRYER